jgi:hypothetical protein
MIGRKGQGTTEYLIILAVIIVIALVVAGVMGWFPALGAGITESQSKTYWRSTTPLSLDDWTVTTSGAQFVVRNNTTDTITLTDITMEGSALGLSDTNIAAGGTTTTALDNTVTCVSGQTYSYDIIISYDVVDGISGKSLVGTKPIVGQCP